MKENFESTMKEEENRQNGNEAAGLGEKDPLGPPEVISAHHHRYDRECDFSPGWDKY